MARCAIVALPAVRQMYRRAAPREGTFGSVSTMEHEVFDRPDQGLRPLSTSAMVRCAQGRNFCPQSHSL